MLAWGEEEEEEGGPGDVTKSLWRNILLIHVRLYNLAHFYSERTAAAVRRARLAVERGVSPPFLVAELSFVPLASPDAEDHLFFFSQRKNRMKKNNLPPFLALFSLTLSLSCFSSLFFLPLPLPIFSSY